MVITMLNKFPHKTQLIFKKKWIKISDIPGKPLVIYDSFFDSKKSEIHKWLSAFPHKYSVPAGEKLKSLNAFPVHMENILKLVEQINSKDITIVAVGGGSVGDFAGFVASIVKRGVRFVQIPSTWLAAIDSAHGGKTALNVSGYKNQVGTFYPAEQVILMQTLLSNQPTDRLTDSFSESLKIALIQGGSLWKKFSKLKKWDENTLWRLLPDLIKAKYRVVNLDPYEKKGVRHILNLGHTMGHVWEASQGLSHGQAVLYGLRFALDLSMYSKTMKAKEFQKLMGLKIMSLLPTPAQLRSVILKTNNEDQYLRQDKKLTKDGKVRFVLIKKPGLTPIKEVPIEQLVQILEQIKN